MDRLGQLTSFRCPFSGLLRREKTRETRIETWYTVLVWRASFSVPHAFVRFYSVCNVACEMTYSEAFARANKLADWSKGVWTVEELMAKWRATQPEVCESTEWAGAINKEILNP
jgi:hypothetical protein